MVMLGWVLSLCGFPRAGSRHCGLHHDCLYPADHGARSILSRIGGGRIWPPLRGALTLLAQAVPLIVVLFLLFPRVTTGFRLLLTPNLTSASGFSDRLSPGSVESLAASRAVAFRAEFPDDDFPPARALYWRGLVLTQGDGMEWRSRETSPSTSHSSREFAVATPFANGSRSINTGRIGCLLWITGYGLPARS